MTSALSAVTASRAIACAMSQAVLSKVWSFRIGNPIARVLGTVMHAGALETVSGSLACGRVTKVICLLAPKGLPCLGALGGVTIGGDVLRPPLGRLQRQPRAPLGCILQLPQPCPGTRPAACGPPGGPGSAAQLALAAERLLRPRALEAEGPLARFPSPARAVRQAAWANFRLIVAFFGGALIERECK